MTCRCSIGITIGLPAAGKSSWIHILNERKDLFYNAIVKIMPSLCDLEIQTIEFDREIGLLPDVQLVESNIWKEKRIQIYNLVEQKIKSFLNDDNKKDSFLLILLDDNMYYKSMRRIYYSLSLKYTCSYWQIFVHSEWLDLDFLIQIDQERETSVGAETIIRMFDKFEFPDLSTKWEKNTVQLNFIYSSNGEIPFNIFSCFIQSIETCIFEKQLLLTHEKQTQSFKHVIDLSIRNIVGEIISDCKNTKNNIFLRKLGIILSEYKKEFLSSLPNLLNEEDKQPLINEFKSHCEKLKEEIIS